MQLPNDFLDILSILSVEDAVIHIIEQNDLLREKGALGSINTLNEPYEFKLVLEMG